MERPAGVGWRRGCGCLAAVGCGGLLVIVVLAALALNAVFDREPAVGLPGQPDQAALFTAVQKLQTAIQAGFLADSGTAGSVGAGGELELELSGPELEALFQMGLGARSAMTAGGQTDQAGGGERIEARFVDGQVRFRISRQLRGWWTPFGNWVNLTIGAIPAIHSGQLAVTMTEFRVGQMPLPLSSVQGRLDEGLLAELTESPHGRLLLKLVDSLETSAAGIRVRFRPAVLVELLGESGLSGLGGMLGPLELDEQ